MANFAVIEDGKVTNKIVAESKNIAEEVTGKSCVEYADADIVDIGFDYIDGEFIAPVEETPAE